MSGPPKAASPSEIAAQQSQINAQTIGQELSSSNQTSPFGSVTYVPGPNGTWTAVQNYSPVQQGLLNTLQQGQQQASNAIAPMVASGNYGAGTPNFASISAGPTADLVSGAVSAIKPQAQWMLDQQSTALQNMGLPVGSEAYNRGMEPAFQGLGSAISGFESMFQPTAFNEALTQFQTPLNIGSQLAQLGSPTPLQGTFMGSPSVTAPFSNAAENQKQSYLQKANNFGGMLQGITTGLGALLAL